MPGADAAPLTPTLSPLRGAREKKESAERFFPSPARGRGWGVYGWFFGVAISGGVYGILRSLAPRPGPRAARAS